MMKRHRVRYGLSVPLALAALLVAACSSGANSVGGGATSGSGSSGTSNAPLTTVKMQFLTQTAQAWPAYIAEEEGFFKKNGIAIDFLSAPNSPSATAALVSGSYDIAVLDMFNVAPLLTKGLNFKEIVNIWPITNVMLAGKSGKSGNLNEIMPLPRGTTASAPSAAGASAMELKYVQIQYGGKASDVTVAADLPGAALLAGRSQYMWTDPLVGCELTAKGAKQVFSVDDPAGGQSAYPKVSDLLGLPDSGLWATGSWVDSHPKVVTGMQSAMAEAMKWMAANPTKTASLLRASPDYNAPTLSGTQWQTCVTAMTKKYSPAFAPGKVADWDHVLKATGVITQDLPPMSTWAAPGLPAS
jgi:NitT/TauT family transport system substrate-binding protein